MKQLITLLLLASFYTVSALPGYDIYSCGLQITKIVAFSQDTVIAVGSLRNFGGTSTSDYSFILRSTDGGIAWDYQERFPTKPVFNDIARLSSSSAIITGNNGLMEVTNDAGATWNTVSVPTTLNINHIEFTDTNTGFATCDQTKYLKTTNGGTNWTLVNVANSYNPMYDIFWLTPDTGYICGDGIYRTYNAGTNWTPVNISVGARMREMHWTSKSNGIIGTENTVSSGFLQTTTGGSSFTHVPDINFYQLSKFDSLHFIGVSGVFVFETLDGGATWNTKATIPINYTGLQAVTFFDSLHGWIGGNGIIYHTTDGGVTWNPTEYQNSIISGFTNSCVVGSGGVVSIGSKLSYTNDGGMHWSLHNKDSISGARYISFLDAANGFATSASSTIYSTSDSGNTWHYVSSGSPSVYDFQIYAFDQNNLMGCDNLMQTSNDGGVTWTTVAGSQSFFSKVDSLTGFYTQSYTLYQTIDGGQTYQSKAFYPSNGYIRGVDMSDSLNGFILDQDASNPYFRIYTTNDNWNTITKTDSISSLFTNIVDVLMLNPTTILILTDQGLFASVDGGYTFTLSSVPFDQFARFDMLRVNSHYFLMSSASGIIYGMDISQLINEIPNTDVGPKNNLVVFPNPARNLITLKSDKSLTGYSLEIINSFGVSVKTQHLSGEFSEEIHLNLGSGIYWLVIKNRTSCVIKKLVIQ